MKQKLLGANLLCSTAAELDANLLPSPEEARSRLAAQFPRLVVFCPSTEEMYGPEQDEDDNGSERRTDEKKIAGGARFFLGRSAPA